MAIALGRGFYTVAEAARYTRVPQATVRAWFKQRHLLAAHYADESKPIALDFLDLIDVYIVGRLRRMNVSLPTIRKAYEVLQEQLHTEHPFCHNNLATDGKRVFLDAARETGSKRLSDVIDGQFYFRFVLPFLKRISYNRHTSLAEEWRIERGIVINPLISSGEPVIQRTAIPADVIARAYVANGKDDGYVADIYEIDKSDVHNALEFRRQYDTKKWRLAA